MFYKCHLPFYRRKLLLIKKSNVSTWSGGFFIIVLPNLLRQGAFLRFGFRLLSKKAKNLSLKN